MISYTVGVWRGPKLRRASVIGLGVYSAAKKRKLRSRHSIYSKSYDFDDWNEWREDDGMLCRNNDDCTWINFHLYCKSYELDFTPNRGWLGENAARIKGECECRAPWMSFDRDDLECN